MSWQGNVTACCPSCAEEFQAPVWSFVHGGKDVALRDQAKAAECNLLLCPSCNEAFLPEVSWIYFEPEAEIVAFVFPPSFRAEEARWREKMKSDFDAMRSVLGQSLPVDAEPLVFFGPEELASLLDKEDWRRDERDVMASYAGELGLSIYKASPSWAREIDVPSWIPSDAGEPTRASLISGMRRVLAANDRLTAWSSLLAALESDKDAKVPPPAKAAA